MRGRLPDALPLGALERFHDLIVMPAASILRPKPKTYRLVAESDGLHVIASDGTDVGPLAAGGGVAVSAQADNLAAQTVTSGTSVLVTTGSVTLAAGSYLVMAKCRPFSSSVGNPGNIQMRKSTVAFGPLNDIRGQGQGTAANLPDRTVAWVVAHAGGAVTFDLLFNWEAGSTVFGNGDGRFSQQIVAVRIGS